MSTQKIDTNLLIALIKKAGVPVTITVGDCMRIHEKTQIVVEDIGGAFRFTLDEPMAAGAIDAEFRVVR